MNTVANGRMALVSDDTTITYNTYNDNNNNNQHSIRREVIGDSMN